MDKTTLRRQLKAARNAFNPTARRLAARASLRLALRHGLLLRAQRIGFYLPQGGEFDAHPLINQALSMQRECYLPVLPRRGRVMRFGRIGRNTRMANNRYGIPEPIDEHPLRARQLDLLLMPLVDLITQATGWAWAAAITMQHWRSCSIGATGASHAWWGLPTNASGWKACRTTRGTCRWTRC